MRVPPYFRVLAPDRARPRGLPDRGAGRRHRLHRHPGRPGVVRLAGGMPTDPVTQEHGARSLEPGDRLRRELADTRRGEVRARAELDERDHLLTEPVMRPADDEGVQDVGMAADRLLDLLDEDLLAAGVDHHRVPAEQY